MSQIHDNPKRLIARDGVSSAAQERWIDVWKGIAIIAVVVGHSGLSSAWVVYCFHMPLCLIISGYLYRLPLEDGRIYLKRKAVHLLVPYLSWLCVLSFPQYLAWLLSYWRGEPLETPDTILRLTCQRVFGGEYLTGWCGSFWFVTVLFVTQQVFRHVYTNLTRRGRLVPFLATMYLMAMVDQFVLYGIMWPWAVNAVPLALTFFWFGHAIRNSRFGCDVLRIDMRVVGMVSAVGAVAALVGLYMMDARIAMDVKHGYYGIPGVSVLLAVFLSLASMRMARIVDGVPFVRELFAVLGRGSMIVMYLHPLVLDLLDRQLRSPAGIASVALALVLPCCVVQLCSLSSITRLLFLGDAVGTRNRSRIGQFCWRLG